MVSTKLQFTLPDLLAACPFKDATNPHYKEAAAESRAWINSYNVFTDRKRAFFVQGSNELLCSHVYAYAGYEQFRTCCDFVNLLFVVDEVSDDQNGKDAKVTCDILASVMEDPCWDDGSLLARITQEFRARLVTMAGPNMNFAIRRFIRLCRDYTDSVSEEAALREKQQVLDLQSFTQLRRNNSAILLCFSLIEFNLGINLDDKVYEDPDVAAAYWAACDFVCWSNDVYSFDMEQAKGHTGNNVVTVLMKEKGFSLQNASDYIGVQCKRLVDQYSVSKAMLYSRGLSPHSDIMRFVEAMGDWMIGNLEWSFETTRYFGSKGSEVRKSLVVTLRPIELPDVESRSDEE